MPLTIDVRKLLAWNDTSAHQWHRFITVHPAVFTLPSDIRNSTTVAHTLQHIVAAEQRYAQRLASLPETAYEDVPCDSIDAILSTHQNAFSILDRLLVDPAYDWQQRLTFTTITAGTLRSSRETILLHLTLHSIRHYAQLATLVRQHGFKPDWPLDFLFMDAERAEPPQA